MDSSTSLTPVSEWDLDANGENGLRDRNSEPCAICGQGGAREWLRAPDRLHGRQEKYTLLRCPVCSLVWLSKPPKPPEMHRHYTDAYDRLISAAGENSPERWRGRNAALAPHKQSGVLLDLGCSSGAFLQTLRGKGWDLISASRCLRNPRNKRKQKAARMYS